MLDFLKRFVLDLADALLGYAYDATDFFQRQGGIVFLLPIESAFDHRLFDGAQLSKIIIDDRLQFINAFFLNLIAASINPIALFHIRFKFNRETRVILAGLL